ncbi:DNRLRE domain-containing protein, partial [Acrocarpospora corrugata]|uniref:DNRLRE domain-containing protein n=1 Tax=Acrocarpospora corrugata TaxID=35763 RepID=UPI0014788173
MVNDVEAGTLTALVEAVPATTGVAPNAAASQARVYAVTSSASATASGTTGSFEATDLKPSGTWQVGLSGGGFTYSYPIPVPPGPSGAGPALSFDYSSTSVDSLMDLTNNQASVVGSGWDLNQGFIEQTFYPCSDGADRCWASGGNDPTLRDLTLSVGGRSSHIVKDATSGDWKTVEDFGWKIEFVSSSPVSGQPYWTIVTQDGTRYRLGYQRDASLQIPFQGDDAGEPCHNLWVPRSTGGATSMCTAPYRWLLDQEVDARGNVIDYTYQRDANGYCSTRMTLATCWQTYDRGAYLTQVSYGSNLNVSGSAPTARVQFAMVDRTLDGLSDVPLDLRCETPSSECFLNGPAFFISKRLASVTTQTYTPATGWDDVTRLELGQDWLGGLVSGGETQGMLLWLDSIRQVGLAGNGPDIALPPVKFDATLLNNRNDSNGSDRPEVPFPRIDAINNELGGRTEVTYGQPSGCDISPETKAVDRDNEGSDCYWLYASNYMDANNEFHLVGSVWNKFMVTRVVDRDLVGGSPDMVTDYQYLGTPAWALPGTYEVPTPSCFDPPVRPPQPPCVNWFGEWSEHRGYPTVRTIKGSGTDASGYSVSTSTFFRGLYEDKLANGSPKNTTVIDFENNTVNDLRMLSGRTLQEQAFVVTGWTTPTQQCQYSPWSASTAYTWGDRVSYNNHHWISVNNSNTGRTPSSSSTYWSDSGPCPTIPATMTFQEQGGTRSEYTNVVTGNGPGIADPHQVNQTRQVAREKVTSGWRYTETATTYNVDGLPSRVNEYGERGVASDNTCTATTYAKNTANGAWMISYPASEERRKGDDCASGTFMGRSVTLYDGATGEGANLPTKGNATESRAYTSATDFTATKVTYDGYGRSTSSTDPLNKMTTTTYTPFVGWPTGGVAVIDPLGHTTTTWANPEFGVPIGTRNEAGYDTNIDYDPLGRTVALWTPAQPKSGGTAAATVTYTIPVNGTGTVNGPARTAVSKLQTASIYVTTYSYDDGFGRTRETQVASPAGGRVVNATVYDARGLTSASSGPAYNAAQPGSGLLNAVMSTLPQWTKQTFDGVGRAVVSADMTGSSELRRTTTNYFGDRTEVIPSVGGKTVSYTDAEDKVTKIEEWLTGVGAAPAALQGPTAAKAASGRVLLADRTTEDSQTFRNPDGSFTAEFSSGPVRVRQPDGGWAGVDTTLVEVGGVLKPKVAAATVEFSLGGRGTLARLEGNAGERFALEWPADLPRPQVKGNVATYVDGAGPGADLVVTALSSGFRHDVVLRQPPSGPVEYRLPVVAQGMTLARSREGGLALTDGGGRIAASAPAPIMWDASGKRGRTGKIATDVVNEGGRQVLVLRPDPAFLADKATKYPVTVDPTTTLPVLTDAWVSTGGETGADTQSSPSLYAGTLQIPASSRVYDRAYLTFNAASLTAATVSAATLNLYRTEASGCGDASSGIRAQRVTGSWTTGGLTWSSQPATTTTGQVTANDSATCGAPGYMTWNVLPFAQAWASGTANNGIMLRGADEVQSGRPEYDRGFHSNETTAGAQYKPSLSVTYTSTSAPTATQPAVAPFRTVSGTTTATSLTPQLAAIVSDPMGGPLTGEFEVEHDPSVPAQGSGQIWTGSAAGIASGQSAAVVVPAGEFTAGWLVRWRVRAVNPAESTSSAWSSWQTLRVDPSSAQAPTSSPIAHWKFNGDGGDATGTTGRTATLGGTSSWTDGVLGGALAATGGANSASTAGSVMRTDQSYTVSAWMRVQDSNDWYDPIRQVGTNKPAFYLGINPSGQLQMVINNSDTPGAITYGVWAGSYPIKRWFHITGVYDRPNGRVRLYRDGTEIGTNTVPLGWQAGGQVKFGAVYNGQIDDVRIYQKVLTPTEIAAIAAGSPAPDRTPVADQLSVTPTPVTSLTPTLSARVSEPGAQALRAEFQAEHDGQQVWTGSKDNVTSGTNATVQIPAGELEDGWEVRWRARAVRGDTASAWSSWQTFTVNTPKPSVSALQLTPSAIVGGQTVTSTVTPQLKATVSDPGGATLRADFEVEQPHGTSAWTGNVATVASGGQAQLTVPNGELIDGIPARWRVRAVNPNGNITSAWSPWQDFTLDTPDPSIGSLQTDPSTVSGTETLTPTLTPNLRATVSEPGNSQVKAEFEIEHDGQQIWTGSSLAVASGQVASMGVPSGELTDGWTIRWRARAVTAATSAASAWSEWQTVTVHLGPIDPDPAVTALEITPSEVVEGVRVATSVMPALKAQVTDPAGGTLRAEFEVEHDGQQVWAGADEDTPAGSQASVVVPAGELQDGWNIRWRARALAGTVASDWSAWQDVRIDRPDPSVSDLSATESLTPELSAKVFDPDGGTVSAEFEVEHDSLVPAQGTGQIWTGAAGNVASGETATVTVPVMTEGWKVRWRVRAVTSGAGTSAWSAWQSLTVTDGTSIPTVAGPRSQPADLHSLTPALIATFSATQGQVGGEFQVEHDPSEPGQGTGLIWSGSVSGMTSGKEATVTVPAGTLQDGWKIRWRTRAVRGAAASEWTSWQTGTVIAPQFYTTTYEYDLNGQLTKQTDANGNIRTFTYDLMGRRIAAHDPDAGDSEEGYDAAGRLLWSTDGKGQKVSHTYDDLGRKTGMWAGEPVAGTKLAEWVYDTLAVGKLTSATRFTNGQRYTDAVTGYDVMGRATGSSLTVPSSEGLLAGTYTFTTSYNTAGDMATYSMPAAGGLPAETMTSTYTDLGLASRLTSDHSGTYTYVDSTTYTATGQLSQRGYGAAGKIKRTLTWDPATGWLNRATTQTNADTATPVTAQDDRYTYDTSGEITRILDAASAIGAGPGQSECYTYDGLHRLTTAYTTTGATCTAAADGLGIDPYNQTYAYDGVGNITALTDAGQTATYVYPAAGASAVRPNAVTSIARPGSTDIYSYDNAGQLTSRTADGKQGTFVWNEFGQLEVATIAGTGETSMVYDADGERLIRRDPDGKATLYLGSMEVQVVGDQISATRYYTSPDGATVAMRTTSQGQTGTVKWMAAGLHGSAQLAIDDATGQVARERYLPFGERRGTDDLPFTDLGFLGKIEDDSTGLTYLSARYYDPRAAKFISTDPLLDLRKPQWANPFAYAGNNPIGLSDPTGLATACDTAAECASLEYSKCMKQGALKCAQEQLQNAQNATDRYWNQCH